MYDLASRLCCGLMSSYTSGSRAEPTPPGVERDAPRIADTHTWRNAATRGRGGWIHPYSISILVLRLRPGRCRITHTGTRNPRAPCRAGAGLPALGSRLPGRECEK